MGVCVLPCLFIFVCVCADMQESSLMILQTSLKGELEANQQQLENIKVTQIVKEKLLSYPFWKKMYSFMNQHVCPTRVEP